MSAAPMAFADNLDLGNGFNFSMIVGGDARELDLNGQVHQTIVGKFGLGSSRNFKSSGPATIDGTVYFFSALNSTCRGYGCFAGLDDF